MISTQLQSCRGLIGAITERGLCSGCGLCESLAPEGHIEMRLNASGYLRPVIQKALSDDDERYIAQACREYSCAMKKGYPPVSHDMGSLAGRQYRIFL